MKGNKGKVKENRMEKEIKGCDREDNKARDRVAQAVTSVMVLARPTMQTALSHRLNLLHNPKKNYGQVARHLTHAHSYHNTCMSHFYRSIQYDKQSLQLFGETESAQGPFSSCFGAFDTTQSSSASWSSLTCFQTSETLPTSPICFCVNQDRCCLVIIMDS